jgi:hypothetical protein
LPCGVAGVRSSVAGQQEENERTEVRRREQEGLPQHSTAHSTQHTEHSTQHTAHSTQHSATEHSTAHTAGLTAPNSNLARSGMAAGHIGIRLANCPHPPAPPSTLRHLPYSAPLHGSPLPPPGHDRTENGRDRCEARRDRLRNTLLPKLRRF